MYPWLKAVWETIQSAKAIDRLGHAVLLVGANGIGKQVFAKSLASSLLCEQSQALGKACGQCAACSQLAADSHPDVYRIEPSGASYTIKIDEIRAMSRFIGQTATRGGCRIILISGAHHMNRAASNALLKSLEEPGDKTFFIVTAEEVSSLLPTISSRCQHYFLSVPEHTDALAWLNAQSSDEVQNDIALRLSSGAPLAALDLILKEEVGMQAQLASDFLSFLGGKKSILALIERAEKLSLEQVITRFQTCIVDLIKYIRMGDSSSVSYHFLIDHYQQISHQLSLDSLHGYYQSLVEYRKNVHQKISRRSKL